jgi:hypothetical protein
MTILYVDGFDWCSDNVAGFGANEGRWTYSGNAAYFEVYSAASQGLYITLEATAYMTTTVDLGGAEEVYCGFHFKFGDLPSSTTTFVRFVEAAASNSAHAMFAYNASGRIVYVLGSTATETSTEAMSTGTWYWVEIRLKVDDSAGVVDFRVNGVSWITRTTVDTQAGGTGIIEGVMLDGNNDLPSFDDFYLADAAGSQTFIGECEVYTLYPDGAGTDTDFTASPVVANYLNVDEAVPDDDTTYNESSTVDDKDTFTFDDLPANTDTVHALQIGAYMTKDDAGARETRLLSDDGTTTAESAAGSPANGSYSWQLELQEDNPSATAWTESEVNGAEFGYTVES